MRIWLVKQKKSLVTSGKLQQAEDKEKLLLTFAEVPISNLAGTRGRRHANPRSYLAQYFGKMRAFKRGKERILIAVRFVDLGQSVGPGQEQIEVLDSRIFGEVNRNAPVHSDR